MRTRFLAVSLAALLALPAAQAKNKEKAPFPPTILAARTVSVIIDPQAGISAEDPFVNQTARKDVEAALLNWGRFQTMAAGKPADLLIVIRRSGKLVDPNIRDPRQNDRIGGVNPMDDGIQVGARQGRPTGSETMGPDSSGPPSPSVQTEIGTPDDTFVVYNGSVQNPLDTAPLWRYAAHDALRPHSVPAVDQLRKAIADAEKAAARKP
jgi:hypothetical protein